MAKTLVELIERQCLDGGGLVGDCSLLQRTESAGTSQPSACFVKQFNRNRDDLERCFLPNHESKSKEYRNWQLTIIEAPRKVRKGKACKRRQDDGRYRLSSLRHETPEQDALEHDEALRRLNTVLVDIHIDVPKITSKDTQKGGWRAEKYSAKPGNYWKRYKLLVCFTI